MGQFYEFGGVADYIKSRRLARAHFILGNPSGRLGISGIARMCGFQNDAHFSRSVRQAYGYTPGDARANGSATPARPRPQAGIRTEEAVFMEWIRSLRR
ncbi:MAG TPA: helix-turn-helix domain-containing protein [Lichenihabitans sp.]|jgi:AraC-like DNA-binding protein|nr:helix-turn-helix domain-containing protein [Lichenihabitans sp.]